jgi:tetratricopeptide (TPR) repeat protein
MTPSDSPASSAATRGERPRRIPWLIFVLTAAILAAYANSFSGVFVYDDLPSIVDNPTLRHFGSSFFPPANSGLPVSGRPMVNVSLALNYALGGTRPAGYHALNLFIHWAAALVLFGLVQRTLQQPKLRLDWSADASRFAAVTALLWALHPLQTEAVSYVAQRAESLMGLFYLLTLYGVARATDERPSKGWTALAMTACALGMATKEVMVSAPLLAFLYDRTFASGSFLQAWSRRRTLYLGLAATWLILAALLFSSGSRGGTAGFSTGVPWWAYLVTQSTALLHYLQLTVWPSPLVFDYGTDVATRWSQVAWPLLAVSCLLAFSLVALKKWPAVGFIGVSFFLILAPSSSVVPIASEIVAEHRMYLPLAALLAGGLAAVYSRWGRSGLILGALVAALFGWSTAQRNRVYRDEIALWSDTAAKQPGNPRAHFNLAEALARQNRTAEAIQHYERAVALRPNFASAHSNLSHALFESGRTAEAKVHAEEALRANPTLAEAHNNLGNALLSNGESEAALTHYREAVKLKPNSASLVNNLGAALSQVGLLDEAEAQYQESLRQEPDNPNTYFFLGNVLARQRRFEEAARCYEQALSLKPDFTRARENLARVRALQTK